MKPKRQPRRLNPDTVLLIRQVIIGVMIVSFVSLLLLSVWYGTRVAALTITTIEVHGGETIPPETIVAKVDEALGGTYLGLVPRRFAFLYPQDAVANAVDSFERVKSFTVDRTNLTTLFVTFTEYLPDSLWCDDTDLECVFLDETGFAFTAAPSLKGGALLRFEKIGMTPTAGVQTFTLEEYETTHQLVERLREQGWYVSRVEIDAASDAYLLVSSGGELKVSLKDGPAAVVDNLVTILTAPEFSHIAPGNFEYIDLRFGNKVFVKEFEPEPEVVPADTIDTTALEADVFVSPVVPTTEGIETGE